MTQEQIYILIGRIEWLEMELRVCAKHNVTPSFKPDNEALYCGDYAEQICAYIRATNDKQVMIDCCKINRYCFYRYGKGDDDFSKSIHKTGQYLFKIHDIVLARIWGVSRQDIENCTYYVNSYEGVCRNSENGDLLPLPEASNTDKQSEPQKQGLPRELDNPEIYGYFARAIELGYMERTDTGYKWKKQQIRLGYFCLKVFEPPRPIKVLETLFGVSKLDSSITQASYDPKRADVKKWRTEMDNSLFCE